MKLLVLQFARKSRRLLTQHCGWRSIYPKTRELSEKLLSTDPGWLFLCMSNYFIALYYLRNCSVTLWQIVEFGHIRRDISLLTSLPKLWQLCKHGIQTILPSKPLKATPMQTWTHPNTVTASFAQGKQPWQFKTVALNLHICQHSWKYQRTKIGPVIELYCMNALGSLTSHGKSAGSDSILKRAIMHAIGLPSGSMLGPGWKTQDAAFSVFFLGSRHNPIDSIGKTCRVGIVKWLDR